LNRQTRRKTVLTDYKVKVVQVDGELIDTNKKNFKNYKVDVEARLGKLESL
jgi:hypothetical protein